jgi:heavy metal sensor kinase
VTPWIRPRSVRVRLTLWYVGATTLALAAYAAAVFLFVRQSFRETIERGLQTSEALGVGSGVLSAQETSSEAQVRRELGELLAVLIAGAPVGVAMAGAGGYLVARRALAPVDRMAERARAISADHLHDRLPVDNPDDELGRLAGVLNDLLARLQASFDRTRQFTADASHELRTPLTAIRSVGETGLRDRLDVNGYREIVGSMLEEADRMTRLVDALLTLSRADAGRLPLSIASVDLRELAAEVAVYLSALAEEKGQRLLVEGAPVTVEADRFVLRQALVNLVDNAIKYSPAGASIDVRCLVEDDRAIVEVCDRGPGVPPEYQAKIFERFFRVDTSRAREGGGTGLGLSIASWAVGAHRGHIEYRGTPGGGATFRVVLPWSTVTATIADG